MESDDYTKYLMRQKSRERLWTVWQLGKLGQPLDEEDARLFELMEGHMQYARLWDRLNELADEDVNINGVDIVLHLQFHLIIENQLAADDPPAVRQVMRILMQKGLKEHEAAHALASVVAFEIFDLLKENRPFDEVHYIRELRKLPRKAQQWKRPRK